MKLGVLVPLISRYANAPFIRTLGVTAERLGFSTLWVGEHVVMFDEQESEYPLSGTLGTEGKMVGNAEDRVELLPFTALAYLAAVTERIRLGTGVIVLPQRNPVYTAIETANVDMLSNGRVDLGIGVGWAKEEFQVMAAPFEKRGPRSGSYVEVMKRLWRDDVSVYKDEYYDLPPCRAYPKPVQKPNPPVIIAGHVDATYKRIAAQGDGWWSIDHLPDQMAPQMDKLRAEMAAVGRSMDELAIVASPYPHKPEPWMAKAYKAQGVTELVILAYPEKPGDLVGLLEGIARDYMDPDAPGMARV